MSQVDTAHAWWSRLRHQGLLLSPVVMLERYPSAPEPAPFAATAKLRDAHTRFVSTAEARKGDAEIEQSATLAWVDALLDPYLGHRWGRVARQNAIPEKLTAVVRIGSRSETHPPAPGRLRRRQRHGPGAAGHGRHLGPGRTGPGTQRLRPVPGTAPGDGAPPRAAHQRFRSSGWSMRASTSRRGASGRPVAGSTTAKGRENWPGCGNCSRPSH